VRSTKALVLGISVLLINLSSGQSYTQSVLQESTSGEVPLCDVLEQPEAFDKQHVKIRGIVRLEFENFTVHSRSCRAAKGVWVMFGGDVATPTPSTWNDRVRKPGSVLSGGGISYPLQKDESFHEFYRAMTARSENSATYSVTATLDGTFFAAPVRRDARGKEYPAGFGHLWCCHLLIISSVSEVTATPVHSEIDGTVASPSGGPLTGIRVESYASPFSNTEKRAEATSDAVGHFSLQSHGNVLTFRNSGYRPTSIVVEPGDNHLRVTLEDAKRTDWIVPVCSDSGTSRTWEGSESRLLLPEGAKIKKVHSADYLKGRSRGTYIVSSKYEPTALSVASKLQKPREDVLDYYLHELADFQQRWIKDASGQVVGLDTRGQSPNGHASRWVNIGTDLVSYRAAPMDAAKFFDRLIDSACVTGIK